MSDKKRNHNTDNKNTSTIYIPAGARESYNSQRQRPPVQQAYQGQQYQGQQYQGQPYQGQPYQGQPYQGQQYQGQPYQGQPYQSQPYQGQPYQGQPYQGQPYQGQPYQEQPYQEQPYQGNIMQQPYQGQYPGQQPQMPQQRRRPPQQPQRRSPSGKKRKKKKSSGVSRFLFKLFAVLLILFIILFGTYSCLSISLIKKTNYQPSGSRNRTDSALSRSNVRSVLLIGTDGRTLDDRGRSDTMILMSLNSATDEISLTSFMRDCYVEIPNYGWDKLNAAYSYGGADLLMDTIEHNFGVRIDDYVSVNFISFANIVDSVDGIDVEISDAEAQEINTILQAEVNGIMGDDTFADMLPSGGKVHLNGKQALSYARIRYVGNADFERTERQRRVIELVLDKVKTINPVTWKNVSANVLPAVVTNMDTTELYLLSLRAPFLAGYDRQQLRIPAEGTYYGQSTPSGDALIVDFESNYYTIKDTVFDKK